MADIETVRMIERMAEEFAEIPEKERYEYKKKFCHKCKWRGFLSNGGGVDDIFCKWAEMNDKNYRDCLPINCKYFEKGKRKKTTPKSVRVRGTRK